MANGLIYGKNYPNLIGIHMPKKSMRLVHMMHRSMKWPISDDMLNKSCVPPTSLVPLIVRLNTNKGEHMHCHESCSQMLMLGMGELGPC